MNSYSGDWNTPYWKPDFHSWWISKMQSGRQDTLEERYAIKLCFKLGKNATEGSSGRDSVGRGQHSSNRVSGKGGVLVV